MCVKWQYLAEQKRTVGLSVIVNMSTINIKMSKKRSEVYSMIGTKEEINNRNLLFHFELSVLM